MNRIFKDNPDITKRLLNVTSYRSRKILMTIFEYINGDIYKFNQLLDYIDGIEADIVHYHHLSLQSLLGVKQEVMLISFDLDGRHEGSIHLSELNNCLMDCCNIMLIPCQWSLIEIKLLVAEYRRRFQIKPSVIFDIDLLNVVNEIQEFISKSSLKIMLNLIYSGEMMKVIKDISDFTQRVYESE